MADQSVVIKKKVEECLKKVEEMKKKDVDFEEILSVLSNTLEEITPDENPVFEGAILNYKLACVLLDVIRKRNEEGDLINDLELNEDDIMIAWENLQTARHLYSTHEKPEQFKKELSDVCMTLGEVEIEKGDFENAIESINECLKYRTELYPEYSRDIADALYNLGLAQYSSAENNALLSEDDEAFVAKAKECAQASLESFKKTQSTLCHVCLDLALKDQLIAKKEEDVMKQVESLKKMDKKSEEIESLIGIIEDLDMNIEMAMEFDVKAIIEREKEAIASTRDLLNAEEEDEEEDEDFEEEEEGDEDDIVIDNVEMLKKSIKRDNTSEEESKRQNMN